MRLVCYYLRKRVKNVPLYYNGNFGTIPLIGHSVSRRIEYSNLKNALASRRKLYNRYGVVFDVAAYGYDIDKSGRVSNYSYELADYGDDFGNPPAYKARKQKG